MATMNITGMTETEEPNAVATQPTEAVATQNDVGMKLGHSGAEIDRDDLEIPKISVVQAVGDLSEVHEPGDIVLGAEPHQKLVGKKEPLYFVPLATHKDYIENLDYDDEATPRTFPTAVAVAEAGLTLKWVDDQKPGALERLIVTALVRCPEDASEALELEFPYEFEERLWTVALWTLRKTAYRYVGKTLLSQVPMRKLNQLHEGMFVVETDRKKLGDNLVYVPKAKLYDKTSEGFRTWAESLVG